MKLLYTLTSYPPVTGGAQTLQHQTARTLASRHDIQVVSHWDQHRTDWLLGTTLRAPHAQHDYVIDGVPVHRIGLSAREKMRLAPFLPLYYPFVQSMATALAAHLEPHIAPFASSADLIHNVRIGREPLSIASLRIARRRDIPFVLTPVHHPRWVGWRYRAYLDVYRAADMVLALTPAEQRTLIELGVRDDHIVVTGMGPQVAAEAHPEQFRQRYQIDGPIVLFLGQHYRYKGYYEVLQAASAVWQRVPDAHFVFIGPAVGPSEDAFRALTDPRIHRLGTLSLQEKTDALAACTLLCVPSTQESFGGVYLEAWSFAKPVIGARIPAVADVIDDGIDGYLVEQAAPTIAERISALLLHPTQAAAFGQAGQRKVMLRYTWERIAERTEAAYRKAQGAQ